MSGNERVVSKHRFVRRHVALPVDHGSWVLLLSPLAIGVAAGWLEPAGRLRVTTLYLVVAALAAFLLRQPLTLVVKITAGRRSRDDLPSALAWSIVYSVVAGVHVLGLVLRGFGYLLLLAVPGSLVFGSYLVLVARREERRQLGLEILAAGALSLAAPAGLWVGLGRPDPRGWLLWILLWAQAAASLVHVYGLLVRRRSGTGGRGAPAAAAAVERSALLLASTNSAVVAVLALAGRLAPLLVVPYLLQFAETVRARLRPLPIGRPSAIGLRQLALSSVFTLLFVMAWLVDTR